MSEKQKFQDVISNIRSDLKLIHSFENKLRIDLVHEIASYGFGSKQLAEETKEWIFDIYLDKFFETDAKIRKLLLSTDQRETDILSKASDELKQNLERVALNLGILLLPRSDKKEMKIFKKNYEVFHS